MKYHILFWLGYFTFNVLRWGNFFDDYWYSLKSNIVEFAIHIIIVYGNIFYLIPKFILRKKYKTYVAIMILILILVYVIRTGLNYLLVTEIVYPESPVQSGFFDINYIIATILGELYVISFVTSIKFVVEWFIEKKKNEDLAKLQMSTELKYLRTQIQPHFFFNTLNNLYALSLQKSDNAPRLVLKLSDMMQYVLYEVDSSKASLIREISHINNFVDIERMRYKDQIQFNMDITGRIDNVVVPPLLFLSFIENCFKHGLKGNDYLKIKMALNTSNRGFLEFRLMNNFNPDITGKENHGIGIINAKRRLTLLYANNYVLNNKIEEDRYYLFLKIPV